MNVRHFGVSLLAFLTLIARSASAQNEPNPIPIMAYYYIWYDAQSWDRAKSDYPLLGRYSSDDRAIMESHIRMARAAGIDGFIVSWKSTFALDRRLEQLMDVAAAEDFSLWIMYQGLDFERRPLPVDRIINDLQYFMELYAAHLVFAMYDRPVVILSGTWEFSQQELETIGDNFRDSLHILGSERSLEGYLRIANVVDGNAYYWSSVDPVTFPDYEERLATMSEVVHDHRGIWVAPAAPGFDARLIGGTRVVERSDGETFRLELSAALNSSPDVIAVISWNEFSENTHIEPSQNYGTSALDILASGQNIQFPLIMDFDSSEPGDTDVEQFYPPFVLFGVFLLAALSISAILFRHSGRGHWKRSS